MRVECLPRNRQSGGAPRDPGAIQAIVISLARPPELDDKTSSLKTPDTLVTGHEEIGLLLTSKHLHDSRLSPHGTTKAIRREKLSVVLLLSPVSYNNNQRNKVGPWIQ